MSFRELEAGMEVSHYSITAHQGEQPSVRPMNCFVNSALLSAGEDNMRSARPSHPVVVAGRPECA